MSDLIRSGNEAMDAIDELEAFDPRAEQLHNFTSDSAQQRFETRRALNFGIQSPIHEDEEYPTTSGLNKSKSAEGKRDVSKPSPAESAIIDSAPKENSNENQNNNTVEPTDTSGLGSGYMYDYEYLGPDGRVITVGNPHASPFRKTSSPPSKIS